jgi:hypothetical protein
MRDLSYIGLSFPLLLKTQRVCSREAARSNELVCSDEFKFSRIQKMKAAWTQFAGGHNPNASSTFEPTFSLNDLFFELEINSRNQKVYF